MFAVGHIALGYLLGKISAELTNTKLKLPILFALTILPDIDLIIPGLKHRGPTHSIIVIALSSLPFLVFYRKSAIPYMLAAFQHVLVGDYLIGGIQLFWPINQRWYGLYYCPESTLSELLEWILFAASLLLLFRTNDIRGILEPHKLNLVLILPIVAVISPLFQFPIRLPNVLLIPHLAYMIIFAISFLRGFLKSFKITAASQRSKP
ncbi:MAG: metal-dependent hydrolase, partial [Candidatus Ranarchaeia archaeon]